MRSTMIQVQESKINVVNMMILYLPGIRDIGTFRIRWATRHLLRLVFDLTTPSIRVCEEGEKLIV